MCMLEYILTPASCMYQTWHVHCRFRCTANSKFDANRGYLVETGPNTSMFEIQIKIPRQIDGKTIHVGDWYEIRYIDRSTPSNSDEKIILKGKIGLQ